jgi:hypothetical protein
MFILSVMATSLCMVSHTTALFFGFLNRFSYTVRVKMDVWCAQYHDPDS